MPKRILDFKNAANSNFMIRSDKDMKDMYPNLYKNLSEEDWDYLVADYAEELKVKSEFSKTLATMTTRALMNEMGVGNG